MRTLLALMIVLGLSQGCTILSSDFEKATFVGDLIAREGFLRKQMALPQGRTKLLIVVPGYRCDAAIADALFEVSVAAKGLVGFSKSGRLRDLTWGGPIRSCDAYGYSDDMQLNIPESGQSVEFQIAVNTVSGPNQRISFWFIYGARVPGDRIFVAPQKPHTSTTPVSPLGASSTH